MKVNSLKVFFIITFEFLTLLNLTFSACNTCSMDSYGACLNLTSYTICFDGKTLSDQTGHCPDNTICTDKQGICLPKDSTTEPGCPSSCNVCSGKYSCVSEKRFGICDASGKPTVFGNCKDEEVCSVENFKSAGAICAKKCDVKPTCSNTEYTTVAPTTVNYQDSCTGTTVAGFYPFKGDSTCTKYVYCETLNGVMTSVSKICKSGYFDSTKKKCTSTKPSTCT